MKKKWGGEFIGVLSLVCLLACARSIVTQYSQAPEVVSSEKEHTEGTKEMIAMLDAGRGRAQIPDDGTVSEASGKA